MRLRRKQQERRRRVDSDVSASSAYQSQRADQKLNIGQQTGRHDPKDSPRDLGRFILQRFSLIILLVVLVLAAANMLTVSSNVKIVPLVPLKSSGTSFLHSQSVYQNAANQLLARSIWNRNKITINTGHISQEMLQKFPELSGVSITLPLLSQRPIVYIQSAQPALLLQGQNGSFVVDNTGKALVNIGNAPTSSQNLPVVTDQSKLDITINRQAVTTDNVDFILTVVKQLEAAHFTIHSLVLPASTSELDVRVQGQPYEIKFNLQSGAGDARQQAGTFIAAQAKLQSQHNTPAEYIDVRVDGRAYYR